MKTFNGNLTSGMALVFYIVWGIKHKVWSSFFGTLTGELVISGSRVSGSSSGSSSGSTSSPKLPVIPGAPGSGLPIIGPSQF